MSQTFIAIAALTRKCLPNGLGSLLIALIPVDSIKLD